MMYFGFRWFNRSKCFEQAKQFTKQQKFLFGGYQIRWNCKRVGCYWISDQFQIPVKYIGVGDE